MAYDLYPAVNEDLEFAPQVRAANALTPEFRNQVVPLTQTQRNNLTGDDLWDNRIIYNTTTDRMDRYDLGSATWLQVTSEPAGIIKEYGGDSAPAFHVLADGAVYPRDGIYAALFAVYGTKYNTGGEPSTHFRVINKKGRVAVGLDASQTEFNALGKTGGAKTHTLGVGELPSHDHGGTTGNDSPDHAHDSSAVGDHAHQVMLGDAAYTNSGGSTTKSYSATPGDGTTAAGGHDHTIGGASARHQHGVTAQGGGGAHNNLQPFVTANFIITL